MVLSVTESRRGFIQRKKCGNGNTWLHRRLYFAKVKGAKVDSRLDLPRRCGEVATGRQESHRRQLDRIFGLEIGSGSILSRS